MREKPGPPGVQVASSIPVFTGNRKEKNDEFAEKQVPVEIY